MMHMISKTCLAACAIALAAGLGATARADDLSTSIMRPTPVDPASGLVAGKLPGGQGSKSYYVAVDLQPGDLIAQLQVAGTANAAKRIDFELLNASARVIDSVYTMAGLEAKAEAAKTFPIDQAGRYVVRLTADGGDSGTFCVLMGGTALPAARASGCPAPAAPPARILAAEPQPAAPLPPEPVAVPAPPPPAATQEFAVISKVHAPQKAIEVISTKCEERLRVGSDFLFDFDRAELRSEAEPALEELARRIVRANNAVMIEGHTDAKGTDSYNQGLSERRAVAVRLALAGRGLAPEKLNIRGFGKTQPVVPNQHADGSDDPEGRQRNRRVEVVINTCS